MTNDAMTNDEGPLTLALSPAYGGEGIREEENS